MDQIHYSLGSMETLSFGLGTPSCAGVKSSSKLLREAALDDVPDHPHNGKMYGVWGVDTRNGATKRMALTTQGNTCNCPDKLTIPRH